jgi:hypothetical protein
MAAKEKFIFWGPYGGPWWYPSTKLGTFDASYDPTAGALTITVRCRFHFKDGKASDYEDEEQSEVSWDAAEKRKFTAEFLRRVSKHWSDNFTFHCTRDWWEDLRADVQVRFVETPNKDAHFNVYVGKIPESEWRKSRVRAPSRTSTRPQPGKAFLNSGDLVQADKGETSQTGAYHEAGHMLGLGDEYPNDRNAHGVAHEPLVRKEFGHGVRRGRDDRQMSDGDRIVPEYGVVFLEALRVITGMDEWSYRAKPPAPVFSEPVDGPLPHRRDKLRAPPAVPA